MSRSGTYHPEVQVQASGASPDLDFHFAREALKVPLGPPAAAEVVAALEKHPELLRQVCDLLCKAHPKLVRPPLRSNVWVTLTLTAPNVLSTSSDTWQVALTIPMHDAPLGEYVAVVDTNGTGPLGLHLDAPGGDRSVGSGKQTFPFSVTGDMRDVKLLYRSHAPESAVLIASLTNATLTVRKRNE